MKNRGGIDRVTLEAKNLELEKARKQIFDLKAQLFKRQYEWGASSYEHDVVNRAEMKGWPCIPIIQGMRRRKQTILFDK